MKFDFVIGNPPYQDDSLGDNDGYRPPVYHLFMDAANTISDKVVMIHPARFLFDGGSTPKTWNAKMLQDKHFKVMKYYDDASLVFSNTEIKGGVAVTYRDNNQDFGAIGIFTIDDTLNSILHKVYNPNDFAAVSDIGVSGYSYHFTELMHTEHPNLKKATIIVDGKVKPLLSKGHEYDLKSNIISKAPSIFYDSIPADGKE